MKILIYVHSLDFGGAERTVSYLSDYFVNQGNLVVIILNENKIKYNINKNVIIKVLNIKSANNTFKRTINIFKRNKVLKKIVNIESPDIILTMSATSSIYFIRKKYRGLLISSKRSNPLKQGKISKMFENWIYSKSQGIIFQTKDAQKLYNYKIQNKSRVIQNAVGNQDIYSVNKDYVFDDTILAVGRLVKIKDYTTLLKAFKLVLEDFPEYKLFIYGQGEEKQNMINFSKELEIIDNVHFKGVDKNAIIKNVNSRCYVLSSKSEGMPNSLMEAMAIGIPSISTDCDYGPRDIIINGKNGLLVEVGDYHGMAQAIKKLILNENYAVEISKEGQKLKESNSIIKISKKYLDFMSETVSKRLLK